MKGHNAYANSLVPKILEAFAKQKRKPRHWQSYEKNIYEELGHLVKKFGDPMKLTPAKFKLIKRKFRNAAFASYGEFDKL